MRHLRTWAFVSFLFAFTPSVLSAEMTRLEEIWESAYLDGSRIGHVQTTVDRVGENALRTRSSLVLEFQRYRSKVQLRMEQGSEETAEGKVTSVYMRQYQDSQKRLDLAGDVRSGEGVLHVVVDQGRVERRVRWNDEALSLYRLNHLFEKRRPRTGDRFEVAMYEPTVNTVLEFQIRVGERENVTLDGKAHNLLRVEMTPKELQTNSGVVRLPGQTWWLDDEFVPVRKKYEMPGLGMLVLERTSKGSANAPVKVPGKTPDIGVNALIALNKRITAPHATRSIRYRIQFEGEVDASTAVSDDEHQEVKSAKGKVIELEVHPVRSPEADPRAKHPGIDFIDSSHYIDVDSLSILKLAATAVGTETNTWSKVLRIERWVRRNMRVDNAAPMTTASGVAESLRGDCRHYAFLATALCRAEGIPARTAIGLLYVEKQGRPSMGFHMWTEVWVDGHWRGIDGTLGLGGVGATHLKITDHSWHGVQSMTPLLPLMQVVGKMSIEVLDVR